MTVGIYEAKTHLASLVERVEKGEEIIITRHGVPVAKLSPIRDQPSDEQVQEAIRNIEELSKGTRLDGIPLRDLIREGRR